MSLPTSKSKTQLAYARSTKTVNKPKTKYKNMLEADGAKSRHPVRNSTGNIYDSIMGQIQPKQQDYIKGLMLKNQKEIEKQSTKNQLQSKKNVISSSSTKQSKQRQVIKKMASMNSHQRTRSQAEVFKDSINDVQSTKFIKTELENEITSNSYHQTEEISQTQKSNAIKPFNSDKEPFNSIQSSVNFGNYSVEKSNKNPIIEALNNSSSSFTKKLEAFELEYPTDERQQRSTHKKIGSNKIVEEHFSCQPSPKNGTKNIYTKDVIITTKPQESYHNFQKNELLASSISPISSAKNSNKKTNSRKINQNSTTQKNFISRLDEYLSALTFITTQFHDSNTKPGVNLSMKKAELSKIKRFSALKQNPLALGQDEEETILVQNGVRYIKTALSKFDQEKLLTYGQQQKLIKQLQKQRKKVSQLNDLIQIFHQQLAKYKKKQNKMKKNQYQMIEVMKEINQQLTQEKNQRRKLENVVIQFEQKIRGISCGKEKKKRDSVEDQERLQRKTIYGNSSLANSQHFNQTSKLQRHSNTRLSSMIHSAGQQYEKNCGNSEQNYEETNQFRNKPFGDGPFKYKNKTQKLGKIISNFDLENRPYQDDQDGHSKSKHSQFFNQSVKNRKSQLHSCKNSYINSSQPGNEEKSRPIASKLIQQLFRQRRVSKKSQNVQYRHLASNFINKSQSEGDLSAQYSRHHQSEEIIDNGSSQPESEIKQTQISEDEYSEESIERNTYCHQMVKRMR